MISVEDFALANGFELNDPVLQFFKGGEFNAPKELRDRLAKGLYKGKEDRFWQKSK